MSISLAALVTTVVMGHFRGRLVLTLIVLYLAFFASRIGSIFWTLISEIFPKDIRGKANQCPLAT